jgi:hypothetical protein
MSRIGLDFLSLAGLPLSLRRWARAARAAEETDLPTLARQRSGALRLRRHLDRLIHRADARLGQPRTAAGAFPRPHNADWAWRPAPWQGRLSLPGLTGVEGRAALSEEVTLFHDCPRAELSLRQEPNFEPGDLAPFGLRLEVYGFEGSFLSLVLDLPPEALRGLTRDHILRLDAQLTLERPLEVFARLNVRNGPNTEQIVRELPRHENHHRVEFDLAYSNLNEKRVESAWIDLIFESPQMNRVALRDLTLSRRRRAQL